MELDITVFLLNVITYYTDIKNLKASISTNQLPFQP